MLLNDFDAFRFIEKYFKGFLIQIKVINSEISYDFNPANLDIINQTYIKR